MTQLDWPDQQTVEFVKHLVATADDPASADRLRLFLICETVKATVEDLKRHGIWLLNNRETD